MDKLHVSHLIKLVAVRSDVFIRKFFFPPPLWKRRSKVNWVRGLDAPVTLKHPLQLLQACCLLPRVPAELISATKLQLTINTETSGCITRRPRHFRARSPNRLPGCLSSGSKKRQTNFPVILSIMTSKSQSRESALKKIIIILRYNAAKLSLRKSSHLNS